MEGLGRQPASQPRLQLCRQFGLYPEHLAFAYDPSGLSVGRERMQSCSTGAGIRYSLPPTFGCVDLKPHLPIDLFGRHGSGAADLA